MHTKAKGTLGELKIAADLVEKGYGVFTELGDLSKIDLIAVSSDYHLHKIQVKCYNSDNGVVKIYATKSGPNYKFRYENHQIDIFAVYVLDRDTILYISANEVLSCNKLLTVRFDEVKNSQTKGVHYFGKYLDIKKALRGHTQDTPPDNAEGDEMVQTTTELTPASEN